MVTQAGTGSSMLPSWYRTDDDPTSYALGKLVFSRRSRLCGGHNKQTSDIRLQDLETLWHTGQFLFNNTIVAVLKLVTVVTGFARPSSFWVNAWLRVGVYIKAPLQCLRFHFYRA